MSNSPQKEWVLPAAIPFANLKRQDLEECVFWLMDGKRRSAPIFSRHMG